MSNHTTYNGEDEIMGRSKVTEDMEDLYYKLEKLKLFIKNIPGYCWESGRGRCISCNASMWMEDKNKIEAHAPFCIHYSGKDLLKELGLYG